MLHTSTRRGPKAYARGRWWPRRTRAARAGWARLRGAARVGASPLAPALNRGFQYLIGADFQDAARALRTSGHRGAAILDPGGATADQVRALRAQGVAPIAYNNTFQLQPGERPPAGVRVTGNDGQWREGVPDFRSPAWQQRRIGEAIDAAKKGFDGVMVSDVGARKRTERELMGSLKQSEAVLGTIAAVSRHPAMAEGDVAGVARALTALAADTLDTERVSVWIHDGDADELRCIDLYRRTAGCHESGLVLSRRDFANEFAAFEAAPYVDASDALTDPRVAGYREVYTRPEGITSMLDVVIRSSGRVLGLVCFEHVRRNHCWTPRDIAFGCQLARIRWPSRSSTERPVAQPPRCVPPETPRVRPAAPRASSWPR